MSPDLAIAIVVVLDVTLLAGLALVMAAPRKLAAHRAAVADRDLTMFGQLDLVELEAGMSERGPVTAERARKLPAFSYQQAEGAGMVLEFLAAP